MPDRREATLLSDGLFSGQQVMEASPEGSQVSLHAGWGPVRGLPRWWTGRPGALAASPSAG